MFWEPGNNDEEAGGDRWRSCDADRFSQPRREQSISAARSTTHTLSVMKGVKERKGENVGPSQAPNHRLPWLVQAEKAPSMQRNEC